MITCSIVCRNIDCLMVHLVKMIPWLINVISPFPFLVIIIEYMYFNWNDIFLALDVRLKFKYRAFGFHSIAMKAPKYNKNVAHILENVYALIY